jgi:hypothetical protein
MLESMQCTELAYKTFFYSLFNLSLLIFLILMKYHKFPHKTAGLTVHESIDKVVNGDSYFIQSDVE